MNCAVCEKEHDGGLGFERVCQSCWFSITMPIKRKWCKETVNGRYAPNAELIDEMRTAALGQGPAGSER